ncbi:hypothetical protein FB567DRAFT_603639 [Paraphoma chrysanthemicola]|uniref:F-box domain-containing protein n=1 Tax=Paraphoma chrysanthemicola TaxID=798071 RepID=A0A8K0R449_9PLEO|nr:hypothetical protein FB567DRAFT_603639 [Paraphoma chrysanthemicola]
MASSSSPRIGSLRRANPRFACFLDLPRELRNSIYDLVLQHDDNINISASKDPHPYTCEECWDPVAYCPIISAPPTIKISGLNGSLTLAQACQTISYEFLSRFYSDRTFTLSKGGVWHDSRGTFIEILATNWLCLLGTSASFIRSLVIDLRICHLNSCGIWGTTCLANNIRLSNDQIEVHALLQSIWSLGIEAAVTFVQTELQASQTPQQTPLDHENSFSFSRDELFSTKQITSIFKCLAEDQLKLKRYGKLSGSVGIKRDGSGGSLIWAMNHNHDTHRYYWGATREDYHDEFVAKSGGNRLEILPRCSTPPSLLRLPPSLRGNIFRRVINPEEPIEIDLDDSTKFQPVRMNSFHIRMTSSEATTSFSKFGKLKSLLRNTYAPYALHSNPYGYDSAEILEDLQDTKRLYIELRFNLKDPKPLKDLRIDVIHLIMETSSLIGDHEANCLSASGRDKAIEFRTISIQQLRMKVSQVLMEIVYTNEVGMELTCPKVWINGLGDVVGTTILRDIVSEPGDSNAEPSGTHSRETVKDYRYKKEHCPDCQPEIFAHVFPFDRSAAATLRYLLWVLQRNASSALRQNHR